ncbi:MAG: hypothetical protein ACTSUF_09060 [Candidatus Heimdallarchaeaceae archaeon]
MATLLGRFIIKNIRLIIISKLTLILILLALGTINYTFGIREHQHATRILNSSEPDYLIKILINRDIAETEIKLENLSKIEGIGGVLYYRLVKVESINNRTNFGNYSTNTTLIMGVSELFFRSNNMNKTVIVEQFIEEQIKTNSSMQWFLIKGEESELLGSFSYNLSLYDALPRANLSVLFEKFPILKLQENCQYIIMPIETLVSAIKFNTAKIVEQNVFLYLQEKKIYNFDDFVKFVNVTYDLIVEELLKYNFSFKLYNNIYPRISEVSKTKFQELKEMVLAALPLIISSIPTIYFNLSIKREKLKKTISLIESRGGTQQFFLRLLTKSELLASIVVTVGLGSLYLITEYITFRRADYLTCVLFFNIMLMESVAMYSLNTKIFKKEKTIIKLKTSLKHKIFVALLKLTIIALLIGAVVSLLIYLGTIFRFEGSKVAAYVILGILAIKIIKQFVNLVMNGIVYTTSKVAGIIFGEMGERLKKAVVRVNKSSTRIIITFSFFMLFVIGNMITYNIENHQREIIANKVGGDITLLQLNNGGYQIIEQNDQISSSVAIFYTHIRPPMQYYIPEGVPIYFVEKAKLLEFLHFKELKEDYVQEIEETLGVFAKSDENVIISRSLEGKLLNEIKLEFFPENEMENAELYVTGKPHTLQYSILTSIDYLPFFSEQNEYWIIAPIDGKYQLNKTFVNIAMVKLQLNTTIESFVQQVRIDLPKVQILTIAGEEQKEDKAWLYAVIRYQTMILLLIGIAMLMVQSPEDYKKVAEILYSRGMNKEKTIKILMGYQATFQIILFIIAFVLGESIAILVTILTMKPYYQHKIEIETIANAVFFGIIVITQIIEYLRIRD